MASKKWRFDRSDWESVWRHVAYPLVGGIVLAIADSVSAGVLDYHTLLSIAKGAAIAGGVRIVRRWMLELTPEQSNAAQP